MSKNSGHIQHLMIFDKLGYITAVSHCWLFTFVCFLILYLLSPFAFPSSVILKVMGKDLLAYPPSLWDLTKMARPICTRLTHQEHIIHGRLEIVACSSSFGWGRVYFYPCSQQRLIVNGKSNKYRSLKLFPNILSELSDS